MNTVAPTAHARIARKIRGSATSDGAGVRLTRVIGGAELPDLDPFLLLDEFGTDRAEDYLAGFPDHPHRGFETVTYMLDGRMRHRDNHGNEGLLTPGSVQWMTAGRGLVHSEMPEQQAGRMRGFQLWVNLPAKDKMSEPRYQEFAATRIPVVRPADGVEVKVIAGEVAGADGATVHGPIAQPATEPLYLDITLAADTLWEFILPEGHNAFAYVFEGAATLGDGEDARELATQEMGVLGGGDSGSEPAPYLIRGPGQAVLKLRAGGDGARLILVAGRPLREPVARHGPFVMNTRQELMQAFVDFQEGRF